MKVNLQCFNVRYSLHRGADSILKPARQASSPETTKVSAVNSHVSQDNPHSRMIYSRLSSLRWLSGNSSIMLPRSARQRSDYTSDFKPDQATLLVNFHARSLFQNYSVQEGTYEALAREGDRRL